MSYIYYVSNHKDVEEIKKFKVPIKKMKIILIISVITISTVMCLYFVNSRITPAIITASDVEIRAVVTQTINSVIMQEYSKQFTYKDIIQVEKDKEDNIVMVRADTLKMNKIACDVALESQNKLRNVGKVGLKIPMGYIMKNNLLAFFGPSITIRMQPIGYIETKYLSSFESAGINQARHKISVQVKTNMRVMIPFGSKDIQVKNEVPISETIIVGKVPETAIDLGLDKTGVKLKSGN
ncbi:sporulation protein YunB [Clostridium coskatii]|uniref:Sporulation protein YunB n=2 Tax=Clostridium coskatii TaxID=1705578 RepID=A0A166U5A7_9CLOT|nr:Sporulation protein YunB [Clostridium coskatii]OBR97313.1 sporulation protein YunB [Clostridium coskatii]